EGFESYGCLTITFSKRPTTDRASLTLVEEAADFADRLEAKRLVHLPGRVEQVRDQDDPLASRLGRPFAGLEDHRAADALHPKVWMGRDIVDPCEDPAGPHAERPGRRAVQGGQVRPHLQAPRPVLPQSPHLLQDLRRMAEGGIRGPHHGPESLGGLALRGWADLHLAVYDAIGQADLGHREFCGRAESEADEFLLDTKGLFRILEQEGPM